MFLNNRSLRDILDACKNFCTRNEYVSLINYIKRLEQVYTLRDDDIKKLALRYMKKNLSHIMPYLQEGGNVSQRVKNDSEIIKEWQEKQRRWPRMFEWLRGHGILQILFASIFPLITLYFFKYWISLESSLFKGISFFFFLILFIYSAGIFLWFLWNGLHLVWPWLAHRFTALLISFALALVVTSIFMLGAIFLFDAPYPNLLEVEFGEIIIIILERTSKISLMLLTLVIDVFVDYLLSTKGYHRKWTYNVFVENSLVKE
jgi:hypothetical protein